MRFLVKANNIIGRLYFTDGIPEGQKHGGCMAKHFCSEKRFRAIVLTTKNISACSIT